MSNLFLLLAFIGSAAWAQEVPKARIDEAMKELVQMASDPRLVELVVSYNTNPPSEYVSMTNEAWSKLSSRDPLVKKLTQNEAAKLIRSQIKSYVSEAFLSDRKGGKVALLSKTSRWSHSGSPKHETPMSGKNWYGKPELDKSSGVNQVQISAPVLYRGKPVGSLVLGLSIVKLLGNE